MLRSLVGSEMCIRDSVILLVLAHPGSPGQRGCKTVVVVVVVVSFLPMLHNTHVKHGYCQFYQATNLRAKMFITTHCAENLQISVTQGLQQFTKHCRRCKMKSVINSFPCQSNSPTFPGFLICLQCFDAVGGRSGRASGP